MTRRVSESHPARAHGFARDYHQATKEAVSDGRTNAARALTDDADKRSPGATRPTLDNRTTQHHESPRRRVWLAFLVFVIVALVIVAGFCAYAWVTPVQSPV